MIRKSSYLISGVETAHQVVSPSIFEIFLKLFSLSRGNSYHYHRYQVSFRLWRPKPGMQHSKQLKHYDQESSCSQNTISPMQTGRVLLVSEFHYPLLKAVTAGFEISKCSQINLIIQDNHRHKSSPDVFPSLTFCF